MDAQAIETYPNNVDMWEGGGGGYARGCIETACVLTSYFLMNLCSVRCDFSAVCFIA